MKAATDWGEEPRGSNGPARTFELYFQRTGSAEAALEADRVCFNQSLSHETPKIKTCAAKSSFPPQDRKSRIVLANALRFNTVL